eukprot:801344-Amphidinium_carterae.2
MSEARLGGGASHGRSSWIFVGRLTAGADGLYYPVIATIREALENAGDGFEPSVIRVSKRFVHGWNRFSPSDARLCISCQYCAGDHQRGSLQRLCLLPPSPSGVSVHIREANDSCAVLELSLIHI